MQKLNQLYTLRAPSLVLRALLPMIALASPMFFVAACTLPAPVAQHQTTANTSPVIQYSMDAKAVYQVGILPEAQAFAITLESKGKTTQVNRTLLPRVDPISGMQGQLMRLSPEVLGFSIEVEYPYPQGADRYLLTFEHEGETPVLKKYRKERLDLNKQVSSGIVADFNQMKARWLGPGIPTDASASSFQGPRSALPPLPLKQKPLLQFSDAISIFDYTVEVDVPVRR